jgi:hypothetical protein
MPVTVDDKPLATEELGLLTVGQVLAHLQQKENRLVVHVLIDRPGAGPRPPRRAAQRRRWAAILCTSKPPEPRRMAIEVLAEIEKHLLDTDQLRRGLRFNCFATATPPARWKSCVAASAPGSPRRKR